MTFNYQLATEFLIRPPREVPVIKGWNRLEGRPRTVDFERSLRAEVRDPLWFLTRQWQFGEFAGEDAGSPVQARTIVRSVPLKDYAPAGGPPRPYSPDVSLEARVEAEPVPLDLQRHVQVTRYFLAVVKRQPGITQARFAAIRALLLAPGAYGLAVEEPVGELDDDADLVMLLAAGQLANAQTLLAEAGTAANDARIDGLPGLTGAERTALKEAGKALAAWSLRFVLAPAGTGDDAWVPRMLEYQFACTAQDDGGAGVPLVTKGYEGGHLDWYAFDVGTPAAPPEGAAHTASDPAGPALSFIPAPVSFGGIPNPRYWEFESRRTEFAQLDANTTDVAKLLLTEFALVYSNDWCVIPYELKVGRLCEIPALLVTDVFNETMLVRAADAGANQRWQGWSMFTLNVDGSRDALQTRLLLTPAVTHRMEGPPVERVLWLRDEMANMAWAVEKTVPGALGNGLDGYDVARRHSVPAPAPTRHPTRAKARYVLGTDVPHNWHPLIPVHTEGSNRSVSLQRARMPGPGRSIHGKVLAGPAPYLVNEEEVTRAGKQVERSWQRARWNGGATFLWLGRSVTTGRGEGGSGLAFDQVVEL